MQEVQTRAAMETIIKKGIKETYQIKVHGKALLKKRKILLEAILQK